MTMIFCVCRNNKLIYSTGFVDQFLINIVHAMIEVGDIFLEDELESINIRPDYTVYIKREGELVYFSRDKNILEYNMSNENDLTHINK
ncbi:uncharacterized protein VNE69_01041 [Vairimorpha necatrix]|uniref:Uncharacterized protein n=1 Tax=Vairimorpha necatrix TaxID=6039 RepID=A0AAX4J7V5_9MICR